MAVPAINPDVAIIHAQQADRRGNVAIWGIVGIQKEAVMSASKAIVTVEEVVDEFAPHPFQVVLPSVVVDAISVVPFGAHPSYADGYYDRDNAFYEAWDPIGRDRERFGGWMEHHVLGTEGWDEYLKILREEELIEEATHEAPASTVCAAPVSSGGPRQPFRPPVLERHSDMQDLLVLDPIHDVGEMGWPNPKDS